MKNLKKITMIVLLAAFVCAIPGVGAVGNIMAWAAETSYFGAFATGEAVYAEYDVYAEDAIYFFEDETYVEDIVYVEDLVYVEETVEDVVYADETVEGHVYFEGIADDIFALIIDEKSASVFGEIKENDVAPLLVNDARTMLPARFIAENLGATVDWDEAASLVTVKKDDIVICITIDSDIATVNGVEHKLDVPAFIKDGRTYTPVRFIAENLGATVDWDNDLTMVIIKMAAVEEVTEEETVVEEETTEEETVVEEEATEEETAAEEEATEEETAAEETTEEETAAEETTEEETAEAE